MPRSGGCGCCRPGSGCTSCWRCACSRRPGYLGVWGKLTAGLRALGLPGPSGKALRDVRRRIGTGPVRRLFEILAGPLGQPRTPGIMFGGYRTVSFDGCKSHQGA